MIRGNSAASRDIASQLHPYTNLKKHETDGPLVLTEGSMVVATESGSLFAFNASGTKRWEIAPGGKIYTSPVIAGDPASSLILVAPLNADFLLAAVSADGNKIVWKFTGK